MAAFESLPSSSSSASGKSILMFGPYDESPPEETDREARIVPSGIYPFSSSAFVSRGLGTQADRQDIVEPGSPYRATVATSLWSGVSQVDATSSSVFPINASRRSLDRPLRVIHVGQFMVRAGIESWLKSLVRFSNPRRIQFARCIVTSPLSDPRVMREMPVPVEVGGADSVRRAARDCDVLLVSGPSEVADWLGNERPPLCVGIAHGDATWTRNIVNGCASILDHVVAVSHAVQTRTCYDLPSTVIYNGVDTSHLARSAPRDEFRARFGFTPEDFVVGSVMRYSSEKRPELLVEAISRLPPRFKLFLVGWGALKQKLLDLANERMPMRSVFTFAEDFLGDYYRAFDAFCLPSDSEGFGLATLEALFCAVPVVTTRTGFAPELLENGVHYLECSTDPDSIATSLLKLQKYPGLAGMLAQEGNRKAEQFGFACRMCRDYETLLTSLWIRRSEEHARREAGRD